MKNSINFRCTKCGFPTRAKKGSQCDITKICSPCKESARTTQMDWKLWKAGMKNAGCPTNDYAGK